MRNLVVCGLCCFGLLSCGSPDGTVVLADVAEVEGPAMPEVVPTDFIELAAAKEVVTDLIRFAEVVEEVTPDVTWEPGPGEAGYPCGSDEDCYSGFCVHTTDGKLCTVTCEDECPFGWDCSLHQASLPDELFVCVPGDLVLCKPCLTNADCLFEGMDVSGRCVSYGGNGSFCAVPCGLDDSCPPEYQCQDLLDATGAQVAACGLTDNDCECTQLFANEGATTDCFVENEWGSCLGQRSCTADGLSDCDASMPEEETCNGLDDDCDAEVDEALGGAECAIENDHGICLGTDECSGAKVVCVGAEPEVEQCDGEDNDCDGAVDEEYPDTDGDGTADCLEVDKDGDGVADGLDNCPLVANGGQEDFDLDNDGDVCDLDDDNDMVADDEDCEPYDASVAPGVEEECDGADNNCNLLIDESFPDFDLDGIKDCVDSDDDSDGDPDETDCAVTDSTVFHGANEVCNGVDDDCNDLIDDGFEPVNCGLGVCQHQEESCSDGVPNFCNPYFGAAVEACDGADNDCDGLVDEALGTLSCGVGTCLHEIPLCLDGVVQICDPLEGALEEVCDGQDNNCNGLVDEELGTTVCGEGLCQHAEPNCVGGLELQCDPLWGQGPEFCDGKDNDCDGLTDEELGEISCGVGQCEHSVPACINGLTQLCDPGEGATDEACDGADNNCNGLVDEELGIITCGLGLCQHVIDLCVAGDTQVCNPFLGKVPESCDGADNDCDGSIDEELGQTTCGLGVCQHTIENCVDMEQQICNPLEGKSAEVCDQVDNDCDGSIDEELADVPEDCNLKDDNCDGQVDEGVEETFFLDEDTDGFGDPDISADACEAPNKYVVDNTDCDDGNKLVNPGAEEIENGIDDDCDGQVDFCEPGSQVFVHTGAPQTFVVPDGCPQVTVKAWGGGGGSGGRVAGAGGGGAYSASVLTLVPGDSHSVVVAGAGGRGGTTGQSSGGGGGGASMFFTSDGVVPLVWAGGGGGGAGSHAGDTPGGAGGGGGQDGGNSSCAGANGAGKAGTIQAGGAAGAGESSHSAEAGTLGQGGAGDTTCSLHGYGSPGYGGGGRGGDPAVGSGWDSCQNNNGGAGGGGGGGYNGGGGGGLCRPGGLSGGGGGGGASIGDEVQPGNGRTPGGTNDPDYQGDYGWGADAPYNGEDGKHGLVVISWDN